jgi:hypothetical protein
MPILNRSVLLDIASWCPMYIPTPPDVTLAHASSVVLPLPRGMPPAYVDRPPCVLPGTGKVNEKKRAHVLLRNAPGSCVGVSQVMLRGLGGGRGGGGAAAEFGAHKARKRRKGRRGSVIGKRQGPEIAARDVKHEHERRCAGRLA